MIRRRIGLGVLFLILFGLGWWVGRGSATGSDLYRNLDVFVEVLQKVEQNYVDSVSPQPLIEGALRGMLRQLDPYSQFLDQKSFENLQATTHGSFGGVGLVVSVRDNYPTVISPIEGSPAWTLGIRSGDVIVRIDGKSSAGLTVEEVANRLRGPVGTHVQVSVRREGDEAEHEYSIERREIVTKSVPYAFMVGGRIGYLRLANFSETSGGEVRAALERLRTQGAARLVLDLRSNPGGLLDQAVDVVEQFVKPNTLVVYTRGRARGENNRFYSSERRPQVDWPLVVLVDQGSASASEIVAGALQDLDRALVVGETTFGKGSVQRVFPLRGRSAALKLTTAAYFTPSGRSIHNAVRDHERLAAVAREQEGEEDDTGDGTAPPVAAPDTAKRPLFHTASGRIVYGGGGIRPDLIVESDSLPSLMRVVESRGLAFRFANRWINTHPGWKPGTPLDAKIRSDFRAFLESEKVPLPSSAPSPEQPLLDRALRRELGRRLGGDAGAAREALEGDPVFERALDVLTHARTAHEVFAGRLGARTGRDAPRAPTR